MSLSAGWTVLILIVFTVIISVPGSAGLVIAVRRGKSGYISMEQTIDRLTARLDDYSRRLDEEMERNDWLSTRLMELDRVVRVLVGQLEEAGIEPRARPEPAVAKPLRTTTLTPARVIAVLTEYFNENELAELSMAVDINIEDVEGDTRRAKIRSLVEMARRQGKLEKLVMEATKARPNVKWQ